MRNERKKKTFTARINNGDEYCSALQSDNDNLDKEREREREREREIKTHVLVCIEACSNLIRGFHGSYDDDNDTLRCMPKNEN